MVYFGFILGELLLMIDILLGGMELFPGIFPWPTLKKAAGPHKGQQHGGLCPSNWPHRSGWSQGLCSDLPLPIRRWWQSIRHYSGRVLGLLLVMQYDHHGRVI